MCPSEHIAHGKGYKSHSGGEVKVTMHIKNMLIGQRSSHARLHIMMGFMTAREYDVVKNSIQERKPKWWGGGGRGGDMVQSKMASEKGDMMDLKIAYEKGKYDAVKNSIQERRPKWGGYDVVKNTIQERRPKWRGYDAVKKIASEKASHVLIDIYL